MKLRYLLAALCIFPLQAQAEIYKSVDADGHVTYSSNPIKGGKRIILESSSSSSAPDTSSSPSRPTTPRQRTEGSSPRDFPRVDGTAQRGRDDTRRRILEEELVTEEKLLAEARRSLKENEEAPKLYRGEDGKIQRNAAKSDGKMKELSDQVELHQNNVDALKTELSKLR